MKKVKHTICAAVLFSLETAAGVSSPGLRREPYSPPVQLSHSSTSALLLQTAVRDVATPIRRAGGLIGMRIMVKRCARSMYRKEVGRSSRLFAIHSPTGSGSVLLHSSTGLRRHQRVRRILAASHRVKFYSINFSGFSIDCCSSSCRAVPDTWPPLQSTRSLTRCSSRSPSSLSPWSLSHVRPQLSHCYDIVSGWPVTITTAQVGTL